MWQGSAKGVDLRRLTRRKRTEFKHERATRGYVRTCRVGRDGQRRRHTRPSGSRAASARTSFRADSGMGHAILRHNGGTSRLVRQHRLPAAAGALPRFTRFQWTFRRCWWPAWWRHCRRRRSGTSEGSAVWFASGRSSGPVPDPKRALRSTWGSGKRRWMQNQPIGVTPQCMRQRPHCRADRRFLYEVGPGWRSPRARVYGRRHHGFLTAANVRMFITRLVTVARRNSPRTAFMSSTITWTVSGAALRTRLGLGPWLMRRTGTGSGRDVGQRSVGHT